LFPHSQIGPNPVPTHVSSVPQPGIVAQHGWFMPPHTHVPPTHASNVPHCGALAQHG
jgi:hypothetical protein